MILTLL